jgi:TonB family protein
VKLTICAAVIAAVIGCPIDRPVVAQADGSEFGAARWSSGSVPSLPSPNAIGWIDEMAELTVDERGQVQSVRPLMGTPGTSLIAQAAADWLFHPAIDRGRAVASHVLVAAIFRPPGAYNNPAPGSPPHTLGAPSSDVPVPVATADPVYPPLAVSDAVAIVEVHVSADGAVQAPQLVNSAPGFEAAALDAAQRWSFRPARLNGQPVSAFAYLVFGFRRQVS